MDKKAVLGQPIVRLCNYTAVYYRDAIAPDQEFMEATATSMQVDAFRLQAGDVLLTKDSETPEDIGVPAFVERSVPDLVCGYHLALLRPKQDRVDPRFLFWSMYSRPFRAQLTTAATGVTRFGLRKDAIGGARIKVPSLQHQRRIVNFLDAEAARLEAVKRSREQVAKLVTERVEAAILDRVVPASTAWGAGGDLDDMPLVTPAAAGWTPLRLKDTVEGAQSGVWGDEPQGVGTDVYCVRVADFDYRQGRVGTVPTLRSIPEHARAGKLLAPGDLLLEKSGGGEQQPVGRVVVWDRNLARPTVCSNFIACMRARRGFDYGYLQLLHRALYFCGITALSVKQTTGIQNPDMEHYLRRVVSMPSSSEQVRVRDRLVRLVGSERAIADRAARQARSLDERRDAVITAAVTGQLDALSYRDAEVPT